MKITLANLQQTLEQTLYPDCIFCGVNLDNASPACTACYRELPWLGAMKKTEDMRHPVCSAFIYAPPISNLILDIKFGKNLNVIGPLANLTAAAIQRQLHTQEQPRPEAILPVPLHAGRLHQRGFNQALELARPLARALKLPLLTKPIIRNKATAPQTELEAHQRQSNLSDAFALKSGIPYKHIAIFDDVITTGATVHELARLLRQHGAEQIQFWSCAHAILQQTHEFNAVINYY